MPSSDEGAACPAAARGEHPIGSLTRGAIMGPYPTNVALERQSSSLSQAEGRGFEARRPPQRLPAPSRVFAAQLRDESGGWAPWMRNTLTRVTE